MKSTHLESHKSKRELRASRKQLSDKMKQRQLSKQKHISENMSPQIRVPHFLVSKQGFKKAPRNKKLQRQRYVLSKSTTSPSSIVSPNRKVSSRVSTRRKSLKNPLVYSLSRRMHLQTRRELENNFRLNDDWEEAIEKKQQLENAVVTAQRLHIMGRQSGRLTQIAGRGLVNSSKKTIRTTKDFATRTRKGLTNGSKKIGRVAYKGARNVFNAAYRGTKQVAQEVIKLLSHGSRLIVSNPLIASIILIIVVLLLLIASTFSSTTAIQDEYDLNGTYLYLTKQDRERSDDKVEYWTNWENPLLYINYQYDEIHNKLKFNEYGIMTDSHNGAQYARSLWEALNQNPDNIKSMKDLYTDKESRFYLKKEDQEEFEELLGNGEEEGRFSMLQELENPFYGLEDPASDQPIKIAKRMGYVEKDKVSNETTLQINANHDLLAVMDGIIRVKDKEVTIETTDTKFTYQEVYALRVKDGDSVTSGQLIGRTNPSGNQVIAYEKELDYVPDPTITNLQPKTEKKWVHVNPGFYFKFVTYLQETYSSNKYIDTDKAQRVLFMYNYFKQYVPGTTVKGVSAVSGNFDVESGINPKRAESDYMPPPVGATATSWDDPAWLSMTGPQIYSGAYPNILKRGLGLGQWTDTADGSVRHTLLLDYAREKGKKWYDLELQLDFMLHGDSPAYVERLKSVLTGSGTTDELTNQFLVFWEGNRGDKLVMRQSSARQWEIYLNGVLNGGTTGVASQTVPAEYRDKLVYGLPNAQSITQGQGYPGNAYALGNCTWYVYNRFYQIGTIIYPYLGNAGYWHSAAQGRGYQVSTTPKVGTAVVFAPGVAGSHPEYGHVGFVEYVNSDGSFLVSEMNFKGLYQLSWRVLHYQPGMYFITPK